MEKDKVLIDPSKFSLVFVQSGVGDDWTLYQDGKEVFGVKSVDIYAEDKSATEHRITYLTGATEEEYK